MPIKIRINGEAAAPHRGKDKLELMLAGGLRSGLTRSALDAVIAEIEVDNKFPWLTPFE